MKNSFFPAFPGLKIKTEKYEIGTIGVLKEVQVACIDLRNEAIKILGIYFS